jgi:hypothetical protein
LMIFRSNHCLIGESNRPAWMRPVRARRGVSGGRGRSSFGTRITAGRGAGGQVSAEAGLPGDRLADGGDDLAYVSAETSCESVHKAFPRKRDSYCLWVTCPFTPGGGTAQDAWEGREPLVAGLLG